MARPVNLDLIQSLNAHKFTQVPVTSPTTNKHTIEDATAHWIRKHRGTGFVIITVEISTLAGMLWEHSIDKTHSKELGLLANQPELVESLRGCPALLYIVEKDKWTPDWVAQMMIYLTEQPNSRALVLERGEGFRQEDSLSQSIIPPDILQKP